MRHDLIACQTSVAATHRAHCSTCEVLQLVTGLEACAIIALWLLWSVDVRLRRWLQPKPRESQSA